MLTTKIKHKIVDNKFIDLDSRFSFINFNILDISTYILSLEQHKYTAIKKLYSEKIFNLFDLKQRLNLRKKAIIDLLRTAIKQYGNNPIDTYCHNSYIPKKQQITNTAILKQFKIIDFDISYNIVMALFNSHKDIITTLINIDSDINKVAIVIHEFKQHIKTIEQQNPFIYNNPYSKLDNSDIDVLQHNKQITHKIKSIFRFYMIKAQKINKSVNNAYRENLTDKLYLNVVTLDNINKVIEHNHKLSLENINLKIHNRINNFIDFMLNKWF